MQEELGPSLLPLSVAALLAAAACCTACHTGLVAVQSGQFCPLCSCVQAHRHTLVVTCAHGPHKMPWCALSPQLRSMGCVSSLLLFLLLFAVMGRTGQHLAVAPAYSPTFPTLYWPDVPPRLLPGPVCLASRVSDMQGGGICCSCSFTADLVFASVLCRASDGVWLLCIHCTQNPSTLAALL